MWGRGELHDGFTKTSELDEITVLGTLHSPPPTFPRTSSVQAGQPKRRNDGSNAGYAGSRGACRTPFGADPVQTLLHVGGNARGALVENGIGRSMVEKPRHRQPLRLAERELGLPVHLFAGRPAVPSKQVLEVDHPEQRGELGVGDGVPSLLRVRRVGQLVLKTRIGRDIGLQAPISMR